MASRFNPGKLFIRTRFNYEKVPGIDSQTSSPLPLFSSKSWSAGTRPRQPSWVNKVQRPRFSMSRILTLLVTAVVLASMLGGGLYRRHRMHMQHGAERKQYHWEHYPR